MPDEWILEYEEIQESLLYGKISKKEAVHRMRLLGIDPYEDDWEEVDYPSGHEK